MAQASAEKLEHTKLAKKEKVASVQQSEQLTSTSEPPLSKGKRTELFVQIVRWERVKVSKSRTLARERRIGARASRGKSGLHSKERQVARR